MINSLTGSSTLTNLNSLSTNSILSINNLNTTSTTVFNNLNSLSSNSILSINNLNATSTTLFTTKQNNLTFSNPFLNTSNTVSLKYDNTKLNIDASGNLTVIGGTSQWTTTGTSIFYNTGGVGIGTNNPNYKLHIRGTNQAILRIETDTNAPNQVSGIEFGIPAFPSAGSAKITSTSLSGDIADLKFYTSSTTNNSTVKMSILGNGNVGINHSAPTAKLHIESAANGTLPINGGIYVYNPNNTTNSVVIHILFQVYVQELQELTRVKLYILWMFIMAMVGQYPSMETIQQINYYGLILLGMVQLQQID